MYHYTPPFRNRRLPPVCWDREALPINPRHHRVNLSQLPLPSRSVRHLTPIMAVVSLLQHEGFRRNDERLIRVDPTTLAGHVMCDFSWGSFHSCLSLMDVIDSIREGCGVGYLLPGEGSNERVDTGEWAELRPSTLIGSLRFSAVEQGRIAIKTALAMGAVVAAGIGIDSRWGHPSAKAVNRAELPDPSARFRDGLALILDGWDDDLESFSFVSPPGEKWGGDGHGWLPYWYATNSIWCYELVCISDPCTKRDKGHG